MVDTLGLKCEPNISVGESIPVRASPIFAAVPERAENPGGPGEELELLRDQRVGELGETTRVEDIQVSSWHHPADGIESVEPPPVVFGAKAETPVLERQVVGEQDDVGFQQLDARRQCALLKDGRAVGEAQDRVFGVRLTQFEVRLAMGSLVGQAASR